MPRTTYGIQRGSRPTDLRAYHGRLRRDPADPRLGPRHLPADLAIRRRIWRRGDPLGRLRCPPPGLGGCARGSRRSRRSSRASAMSLRRSHRSAAALTWWVGVTVTFRTRTGLCTRIGGPTRTFTRTEGAFARTVTRCASTVLGAAPSTKPSTPNTTTRFDILIFPVSPLDVSQFRFLPPNMIPRSRAFRLAHESRCGVSSIR